MDIISSIGTTVGNITGDSFVGKLAIAAGSLAIAYITPIAGLLFACFACTAVDLYYGLMVAKKAGAKLTSSKSWRGTLRKIRDEFVIIMLGHLLEHSLVGPDAPTILSGGSTALICLTEIWSILENLNTLDPDGPWKILGKYLRKKGQNLTGVNITVTKDGKLDIETSQSTEES